MERYVFYQSHYESLEEITPLDTQFWENIKEDLHSCYGNNVAFSRARKKLLSSAPKCPYCLLNRPNTLDHYFDKSDYPEYSVFAPNLIYFIAETKGNSDAAELRGVENAKIACAKAHFAAISSESVTYSVVDSFAELMNIVS